MEKVTVRELIEMLAKCNWDDEVTCITKYVGEEAEASLDIEHFKHKIVGVSRITGNGVQIVFDEIG